LLEENAMKSRGQDYFLKLPSFGARLYDCLMRGPPMQLYYKEVAQDLVRRIPLGKLLDVGTGPGRLLLMIHDLNPNLELFGLDISASMLQQAQKNLRGIAVDLRQGNIRQTDYSSEYFDLVVCTGSFYLWSQPEDGLQEIHRILKSGASAYLYECHREYDRQALQLGLRENLRHLNIISRIIGPLAIKQALRAAYWRDEIARIIERTGFAGSFAIRDMTLSGLPIWVRVELRKGRLDCKEYAGHSAQYMAASASAP
jgi:ubiquinone/menaquinone biosynthesis C-methylase UbiE